MYSFLTGLYVIRPGTEVNKSGLNVIYKKRERLTSTYARKTVAWEAQLILAQSNSRRKMQQLGEVAYLLFPYLKEID